MWKNQPFVSIARRWFNRNFSSPAAVALLLTIAVSILVLSWFGGYLLPILISIVLAYVLSPLVRGMSRLRWPRWLGVTITYFVFLVIYLGILFVLLPLVVRQLANLVDYLPNLLQSIQTWFDGLSKTVPDLVSSEMVQNIALAIHSQIGKVGNALLQFSLSTIPGLVQAVLYIILVPVLVFFFLRDSEKVSNLFSRMLPKERKLMSTVWQRVNAQLAAYLRGRIVEMIIIGAITTLVFFLFGMPYFVLLGALVGVSVIVPYVGGIAVIIPVIFLGLSKWGFSSEFMYMIGVYLVIQGFDAYVLVPYLFSEALDMHPIIIIAAIVLFGGLFGFWGVFFAIPLASVVQTILLAWPQTQPPGPDELAAAKEEA